MSLVNQVLYQSFLFYNPVPIQSFLLDILVCIDNTLVPQNDCCKADTTDFLPVRSSKKRITNNQLKKCALFCCKKMVSDRKVRHLTILVDNFESNP